MLKLVIRSAPGFTDKVRNWLYDTDELDKLWKKLEEDSHRWAAKECTQACAKLIEQFSEYDPKSIAVRYPFDKQEKQTLEQLRAIDFRILKQGVHKISHYLETIIESIHQDAEWRSEVASW